MDYISCIAIFPTNNKFYVSYLMVQIVHPRYESADKEVFYAHNAAKVAYSKHSRHTFIPVYFKS